MPLQFTSVSNALGARVSGLDPDNLGPDERRDLYQAFLDYGLLLVPRLQLTPAQHVSLSRIFGQTEIHPIESIRHPREPEVIVLSANSSEPISDGDPTGEEIAGQIPWHTDLTYTATPSRGALLYAKVVPQEGGRTGWIDTAKVYDALSPETQKRIEGLRVVHSFARANAQKQREMKSNTSGISLPHFPDVMHPLVFVHPENGRKVLNISPFFSQSIVGMARPEGEALLEELKAFATDKAFSYVHDWSVGDLAIWDNWRTMHRAFGYQRKYRRIMHRTTLRGDLTLGEVAA